MFVAATLSLLTALIPQATESGGGGQSPAGDSQPLLSEREQKTLSDRLRQYLADEVEYDLASGIRDREKAAKARQKSKEKFEDEWDKAEKKGNVLGSMVDLRAIFYNCFERERPKKSKGQFHKETLKDEDVDYAFYTPKKYSEKTPWPTLLVIPGASGAQAGNWARPEDYFAETWGKSTMTDEAIFCLPIIKEGLELDPVPDYSREGAEAEEGKRNKTVLLTLGTMMSDYNVERGRVYLDCGRGACGYGLRLVTLFPDRFAGVILRDPVAVEDIRLGNLLGIPILMMKTGDNAAIVDALKARIEDKSPGAVTVMDAKGAYPHGDSAEDIKQWLADKQRNMSPTRVVLEPNHDRFNRAYWVDIGTADSLLTAAPDKKPRIEVKADRAANRITVDSVGVERFELFLNDDLLDLDKAFTIVVNGKAVEEQRRRSFRDMKERMVVRSDWDYLFPVRYATSVPKE